MNILRERERPGFIIVSNSRKISIEELIVHFILLHLSSFAIVYIEKLKSKIHRIVIQSKEQNSIDIESLQVNLKLLHGNLVYGHSFPLFSHHQMKP